MACVRLVYTPMYTTQSEGSRVEYWDDSIKPAARPLFLTRSRNAVASDWLDVLATITVQPAVPFGQVSAPEAGGVVGGVVGVVAVDGVLVTGGIVCVSVPVGTDGVVDGVVGDVDVSVDGMPVLGNGGRPGCVESVWSTDAVGSVGNVSIDENVDGAVVITVGLTAVVVSSLASAYARVPAPIPSTPSPIAKIAVGPSR